MARFYARFDSGSPGGWSPDTETGVLVGTTADGYFNQYRIAASSASAALLRNGLIASRSAASTDFYQELDAANQSGGAGIYFPPNLFTITNGILTASAYTASAVTTQGIVTPANYRTRPTASITSSQTTLIGPTNPLDSGSVNYDVYLSASNAVKAALDSVQNGTGDPFTPYTRLGNQPSRTLHSIWHDPNLQYFAWDDLTPGTPQTVTLTESSSTDWYYTNNFSVRMNWSSTYEYLNDVQATPRVRFEFFLASTGVPSQSLNKTSTTPGATSFDWTINQSNITTNGIHRVIYAVNFRDAQVIAEGGTNIGDGIEAGATGSSINYIRLNASTVKSGGPASNGTNCSNFNSANVNMYTTKSLVSTDLTDTDVLYSTTDTVTPSQLAQNTYAVSSAGTTAAYQTIFTMDGIGSIQTIIGKCSGAF